MTRQTEMTLMKSRPSPDTGVLCFHQRHFRRSFGRAHSFNCEKEPPRRLRPFSTYRQEWIDRTLYRPGRPPRDFRRVVNIFERIAIQQQQVCQFSRSLVRVKNLTRPLRSAAASVSRVCSRSSYAFMMPAPFNRRVRNCSWGRIRGQGRIRGKDTLSPQFGFEIFAVR